GRRSRAGTTARHERGTNADPEGFRLRGRWTPNPGSPGRGLRPGGERAGCHHLERGGRLLGAGPGPGGGLPDQVQLGWAVPLAGEPDPTPGSRGGWSGWAYRPLA